MTIHFSLVSDRANNGWEGIFNIESLEEFVKFRYAIETFRPT